MRKLFLILFLLPIIVSAAGKAKHPKQKEWPFDGIFGVFDRQAAQRGYQVYKEVCSGCHSMRFISFRNLSEIGFTQPEIKQLASEFSIMDGPDDEGQMFERPRTPNDRFPSPYANEKEARASNNGAYPPDLSLIVKARKDGANYLYSLITGYEDPPAGKKIDEGLYYNPYYEGGVIKMAPQLFEGLVTYQDGTEATISQMAKDLTVFMQWAAEPQMENRKQTGIMVMLYLLVFTGVFYVAMNRIWANIK